MTKDTDIFEKNIEEATKLLKIRRNNQMAVAKLAYEACEIIRGGNAESRHTLTEFAKRIKMSDRTLWGWVKTYRDVYLKLDPEVRANAIFIDMNRASTNVSGNSTKRDVAAAYENVVNVSRHNKAILLYASTVSSIYHALNHYVDFVDKEILEELCFYIKKVNEFLDKNNIEPVFHERCTNFRRGQNSKNSVNEEIINIFKETLKKSESPLTPTVLGERLLKRNSKTASKLAALRILGKMMQRGLVAKTKQGAYYLTK